MRRLLDRLREQTGLIKLGALLIPVSIVPLLAITPAVRSEYRSFVASLQPREPLSAPKLRLDPVEVGGWRPLPEYDGAVPVLMYRGINSTGDRWSVTQKQFASQMAMLKRANFKTITLDEYARFLHGDRAGLPVRPILITFDGGRWDSYAGADGVLAQYGFQATMAVPTGQVGEGDLALDWKDLRRMRASGRWDIALEAGMNVGNVSVGTKRQGAFYANLRVSAKGQVESFAAFKRRVTGDVQGGISALRRELPGWQPLAMAPPLGDYGQLESNNARVGDFMRDYLHSRFQVLLLQGPPVYSIAGMQDIDRFQVIARTTTDQLYTWLRHGLSYTAWTAREQRAQEAVITQPIRDQLTSRLAECDRLKADRRRKRALQICRDQAAQLRAQVNATVNQMRLAARGLTLEFSPPDARVAVGKVRLKAKGAH
jgi:peptidoglycan/xylan/chitin deacetylase (PgdA/CDA1 family)